MVRKLAPFGTHLYWPSRDNDSIDGGAGNDQLILTGKRSDYLVKKNATSGVITITDLRTGAPDGTDLISNVEKFIFPDMSLDSTMVLNNYPNTLTISGSAIKENSAAGTIIATAKGTDPDTAAVLSYSLLNDSSGLFIIDTATGVIKLKAGAILDYEATPVITITVMVTDQGGYSITKSYDVKLTNIFGNIVGTASANLLNGTNEEDSISGLGGNDTINGLVGNDTLMGGAGNDVIDGGTGTNTAIFDGKASDYQVTYNSSSLTWTIKDLAKSGTGRISGLIDGTDQLKNIQLIYFTDESKLYRLTSNGLQLVRAKTDMNGDGISDLLVRNSTANTLSVWRMNVDGSYTKSIPTALGADWKIECIGHFDRNQTLDLYVRNQVTLETQLLFLNNDGTFNIQHVDYEGLAWQVVGAGDFDGDGIDDIVWHSRENGETGFWSVANPSSPVWRSQGWPPLDWVVNGIGDFNNDGRSDILWRNTSSGDVIEWMTNSDGGVSVQSIGNASLDTQIVGVDDFNGDGTADILWRNMVTSETYEWIMNNGNIASVQSQGYVPSEWQIQGTGDFNGDGFADILWRNISTGEIGEWLMKNGSAFDWKSQGPVTIDNQIIKT